MKRAFTIFRVKIGWMGLVGNEKGVQRILLPGPKKEELRQRILAEFPEAHEGAAFLGQAKKELIEYFSGRRVGFDFPLELSGTTPFQKKAYRIMGTIPFGEVRTYRWLAQKIGNPKALRAVGGANAKNRWPLAIPCHRVVPSAGGVGGYHWGADRKKALLAREREHAGRRRG